MASLTKEEMERMREFALPQPFGMTWLDPLILRALDELEEHRAREGRGVTLSEDTVEKIREALERGRCALDADRISNTGHQFADALSLLPPKRLSLLEAAKAVLRDNGLNSENADALRSAIEREEGKQ